MPEHQIHIGGNGFFYVSGDHGILGIVIIICVAQAEEHIAPDHGLKAHLAGDFHDAVQMPRENIEPIYKSVLSHVCACTHIHGFVHADMNPFGAEGGGSSPQALFNECIGFFFSRQKNAGSILDGIGFIPLKIDL